MVSLVLRTQHPILLAYAVLMGVVSACQPPSATVGGMMGAVAATLFRWPRPGRHRLRPAVHRWWRAHPQFRLPPPLAPLREVIGRRSISVQPAAIRVYPSFAYQQFWRMQSDVEAGVHLGNVWVTATAGTKPAGPNDRPEDTRTPVVRGYQTRVDLLDEYLVLRGGLSPQVWPDALRLYRMGAYHHRTRTGQGAD
jgi:hypothetical protein